MYILRGGGYFTFMVETKGAESEVWKKYLKISGGQSRVHIKNIALFPYETLRRANTNKPVLV